LDLNIGIIGAGAAGLTAAYELTKRGHAVTLYEAADWPGGLGSGFKAPGWDWHLERFYHHWFTSDQEVIGLIQELGLGDQLFWPRPTTSIWYTDRAYPFDNYLRAALFPHLSWVDKIRAAPVALYLRFTRHWQPLEKVTAHEWLTRWLGQRGYQILFEPLLVGKFGEAYKEVNMAWMWARLYKRSPSLGYLVGGFQAFFDALLARVRAQGGTVHLNAPVLEIRPTAEGGLRLRTAEGEALFDRVVSTISPQAMIQLAPDLPPGYQAQLRELRSLGALTLILALDRPLTQGHYWINLPRAEFPFLALVEHTNYIDPAHYGGDHLIYLGDYPPPEHEYFQLSKEDLRERFLPHLLRFNPQFDPAWVRDSWLFREEYAQPVPLLNHSHKIPALRTPIPGLLWASMSQVYPWDRGTNYAVELGRKVAEMVEERDNKGVGSRE
jgi:protoporphyrinogen oxidase